MDGAQSFIAVGWTNKRCAFGEDRGVSHLDGSFPLSQRNYPPVKLLTNLCCALTFPQGLKPVFFCCIYGTTKVVP